MTLAAVTGKDVYFAIDDVAGSPIDLSAYLKSAPLELMSDTHDTTAFTDDYVRKITGLKDCSFSLDGLFDPTIDRKLSRIVGRVGTFTLGPKGNGSGSVRYTGECVVGEVAVSSPNDDLITFSLSAEGSDTCTRDTF